MLLTWWEVTSAMKATYPASCLLQVRCTPHLLSISHVTNSLAASCINFQLVLIECCMMFDAFNTDRLAAAVQQRHSAAA
jgi:hypothetical protein